MKAIRIFITSTVFLLTGILYAQGLDQRCTQMGDSACVDWDRGVVMAEGLGAPASSAKNTAQKNATALRAAKLDAARNMLEMIKGINLSSSTTMRDAMVQNDTVRTQVQGRPPLDLGADGVVLNHRITHGGAGTEVDALDHFQHVPRRV